MNAKKSLLVVLPVYNEERDLPKNLPRVHAYLSEHLSHYDWHITIAEQASRDRTREIAKRLAATYPHVSWHHRDQKGRGGALKEIWSASETDYLCYMDIDLATRLDYLPALIEALNHGYDIAIGSRLNNRSIVKNRSFVRESSSRAFNAWLRLLFRTRFEDAQCGFKALRRETFLALAPHIHSNGWIFDTELLIIAEKAGYRIYALPVEWHDDPDTTVRIIPYGWQGFAGSIRLFWEKPWNNIRNK